LKRARAALAAALIIVFAATLEQGESRASAAGDGDGDGTLLVIGDSITWGTAYPGFGNVTPQLEALGTFSRVIVDAAYSRNISGPAATKRNAVKTYKKLLKNGVRPTAVLVALGSNDLQQSRRVSFHEPRIRELLTLIGDIPVVWINVLRTDRPYYSRRSAMFNKTLVRLAAEYPNLSIVDWASMIAENPKWFAFDKLHLRPIGYRARAAVYVQAAEAMWVALNPPVAIPETTIPETTTTIPETTVVVVTTTIVG